MEENNKETVEVTAKQQMPIFQENLPNSALVLTLGILSIPFCCCFPLSLPLGIVAWVMGTKGKANFEKNPSQYTRSSYSNMNAGRVCGIVGVVLTVLYLAYTFYQINAMGGWDAYMEIFQSAMEQAQNQ